MHKTEFEKKRKFCKDEEEKKLYEQRNLKHICLVKVEIIIKANRAAKTIFFFFI